MKHLAVEATKVGAPQASREEILELAFKHDMTSPFSAFFAIPASEASRVQGQLADARRRKRWLSADASDSVALSGPKVVAEDMPAPSLAVEKRTGGCAGCVTSPSESRGSLAGGILLLAVVTFSVRARRRAR